MPFSRFSKITSSEKLNNFLAAGVILFYCAAYAAVRLLVSPSMELSEAEQFLDASAFSFGYNQQAPLFTWIVIASSLLFGVSIVTITVVKYLLLFAFYFFFYLIARNFWSRKESLLITGSLLLFPTFSYEVHRDLTHTILVALIATITCYLYIRIVREAKIGYYLLAGVSAGLGILSKYNFVFFLIALLLSSLSLKEGRRVIFDRRILLAVLCTVLIVLPHLVWLAQENFAPVYYAINRTEAGQSTLNPPLKNFSLVLMSYLEVLLFIFISGIFFVRNFSRDENRDNHMLRLFRFLAFYGLMVLLLVILFLQAGNFTSRWLSPVYFALPLAVFSFVRMDMRKYAFRLYGYLCIFIAVAVLAARTLIGFFPDTVKKVERIHIPYRVLAQQLTEKLKESGINDFRGLAIVTDLDDKHDRCVAANIMAWMPGTKYVPLTDFEIGDAAKENIMESGGVLIYDTTRHGVEDMEDFLSAFPFELPIVTLKSAYFHSSKFPPYVLRVVIIPKKGCSERRTSAKGRYAEVFDEGVKK